MSQMNQTSLTNTANAVSAPASSPKYFLLASAMLVLGFVALISWFQTVDFYHASFFTNGYDVFLYNVARSIFALYVAWILIITGHFLLARLVANRSLQSFTPVQRVLLNFGTGLGCWHILMLLLGIANLYYNTLLAAICVAMLALSGRQFLIDMADLRAGLHTKIQQSNWTSLITTCLITAGLFWLLLVRGFYPSGGGDYYTHYFYYYMSVIQNHGLVPNDVWYHYYYSKGAGLHFLGMLLTDPQAPSLMTFICVAAATVALVNLVSRYANRSLWPLFCGMLFILYNVYSISGEGGEFQKVHEETTAMVILVIWAVSMLELNFDDWMKPAFVMLATLVVGAAMLTQAIAVFLIFFFAAQGLYAILRRQWRKLAFYFLLSVVAVCAIVAMLLMNYLVTGLATDQAINLTWKFANLERLNQWGVIPNVMMVAWIRDNYDLVAVPWTLRTVFGQLLQFLRADIFKLLIIATIAGCLCYLESWYLNRQRQNSDDEPKRKEILVLLRTVFIMISVFSMLSVFFGHSQAVSYYRFSSFFVPLLLLFCTLVWVYLFFCWNIKLNVIPVLLLAVLVASWNIKYQWNSAVGKASLHAVKFFTGKYSLAEAYSHQSAGLAFGGINPGAYAAAQHVPQGSRIWSTNVDSYCMVPDCKIESTISFMMSPRLSEILSGKPEDAKRILQQEGLNYFIVSKDSQLLDLLPFSQLFSPSEIGKHLAIKWQNGTTYLLTWRGKDTKPVNAEFIRMYKRLITKSDHPWFRFDKAVPAMNMTMNQLSMLKHPWKPFEFPWRQSSNLDDPGTIKIRHAAYGRNCILSEKRPHLNMISGNNVTKKLKALCQHKKRCKFDISERILGDPVTGCKKSFKLSYWCVPNLRLHVLQVGSDQGNNKVEIHCA